MKNSGKSGPHSPNRKKPQDRNDHSQWQTRRRHENVKAKYVENHGSQNRQRQRHVAIRKQQDCGYYLQHKNHHVKPGHEEGSEELSSDPRGRRHGNKMKEPVEPECQKDQTKQVPCDYRSDLHAHLLVRRAIQAQGLYYIDAKYIDIDTLGGQLIGKASACQLQQDGLRNQTDLRECKKLPKGGTEGELSLARDDRFAFRRLMSSENAQGPLNFPHTYQLSVCKFARLNDLRICTPVFLVMEFS
jgi:hypothetical protein